MKTRLLIKKTAAALLVSAVMVSSSTLTAINVSAAGAEVDTAEALQTAIKNAELNPTKLTLTADIIADANIVIDTAQDITIDLDVAANAIVLDRTIHLRILAGNQKPVRGIFKFQAGFSSIHASLGRRCASGTYEIP